MGDGVWWGENAPPYRGAFDQYGEHRLRAINGDNETRDAIFGTYHQESFSHVLHCPRGSPDLPCNERYTVKVNSGSLKSIQVGFRTGTVYIDATVRSVKGRGKRVTRLASW
jgi:hypothetical protein